MELVRKKCDSYYLSHVRLLSVVPTVHGTTHHTVDTLHSNTHKERIPIIP